MADKKKTTDKRTVMRELAEKLATAYVAELQAEKRHQDAVAVTQGARTPNAGDMANIQATKKSMLGKARARLLIMAEMDTVIGIQRDKKTPPGKLLDAAE